MNGQKEVLHYSAKIFTAVLFSALLSTLAACGGGGDSGGTTTSSRSPSTPPPSSSVPASGSYLVAWQAVNDPDVSGYKLYYSTTPLGSSTNAQTVTLGSVTSYTFLPGSVGIAAGSTVYVAVAAISASMESALSDQASIVVQ